ncbi:hypothetical protein F5878DRAFT_294797 [Lentinula raphanica]|uniref:Uncharacterized protein n=1 Tax=Lentinula raphanica TaxID=153919 RepID=A0AA38UF27_9AGAR|nr:hypothetical protein F5878DRAFT_294797 [Lentinula raphanica]
MLLHISPSFGQAAQCASNSLLRLLLAFLLVKQLLSIDVIAQSPAHPPALLPAQPLVQPPANPSANSPASGPIKNEIHLYGFRTKDGDVGVYLAVDTQLFCGVDVGPCPSAFEPNSVFLGYADFVDIDTRTQILGRGPLKNAYEYWQYVDRFMTILSYAPSGLKEPSNPINRETLLSWTEKLDCARKSTKIPEETWSSWAKRIEKIFVVEYVQRNSARTGKACLLIGADSYCLPPQSKFEGLKKKRLIPQIGYATFANTRMRDAFRDRVGMLQLEGQDPKTVSSWVKDLKVQIPNALGPVSGRRVHYLDYWAFLHQVMTNLLETSSGLETPHTQITQRMMDAWKTQLSMRIRALESKKEIERKIHNVRQSRVPPVQRVPNRKRPTGST